ncbi:hypothetical protein D3C80_530620 [compost metagenome]
MDLLTGRQLEGQVVDVQVDLESPFAGKFLGGVFQALSETGIVDLQAKGGQQFTQLAVGVVQPFAQLGGHTLQGFQWLAAAHQGLHAADLQFHVRQCLGQ